MKEFTVKKAAVRGVTSLFEKKDNGRASSETGYSVCFCTI